LIDQTNDQVTKLKMRAGIGAGTPGYDGIVEANRATSFVPTGRSVWELGTGGDPARKANDDYRERTKNPLGEYPASTTFVFVTSRRWPEGEEWARTKRAEGPWQDVKVLDVDDIEVALEAAPAAHFWISELLDKPVAGIQTIEAWWSAFSAFSNPILSPELVLAGRPDAAAALLRFLEQDCQITAIASASTDDVLAFVAAVLLTSPEESRDSLIARTLIVKDALSLRRLEATSGLLILLPFEDQLRRDAELIHNHHVVFLAHDDAPADITLPAIDYDLFKSGLEKLGIDRDRAHRFAGAAHQSLVVFQRLAARKSAPPPIWQTQLESRMVRRAWLAGGWNEHRTGDQEVLSALLGNPYDEARDELRAAGSGGDPLFTVVGDTWALSSIEASWPYARRHLAARDMPALEGAIQTVLGAVDPALDLPVEKRWMASIHGKTRVHSGDLRRGLAQTLGFLGARGDDARLSGGATASTWADSATTQLLQRARDDRSGQLWSSLADVLPLLAEAAPDAFLAAVDAGAAGARPVLAGLFIDKGDVLSVNSPHTGLLWALETLAWSDEHASFALRLLARLAEIDPGGRLSNRPLNSLVNTLKPWLPQTSLSVERRVGLLDYLLERQETVAWELMIKLLPDRHAVGFDNHAPRFRPWRPPGDLRPVAAEYWVFIDEILNRVLRQVDADTERWIQVVEKFADLTPPLRAKVRDRLSEIADGSSRALPELGLSRVWGAVEDLIRHHRTYPDARGALSSEELGQLADVSNGLRPADPVEVHRWLFDEHVPDLGEGSRADFAEYQELLQQHRTEAARKIYSAKGLDGVIDLARECELPWQLGFALADSPSDLDEDQVVDRLDDAELKLVEFARGYVARRLRGVEANRERA
jgi:hypothetical protein